MSITQRNQHHTKNKKGKKKEKIHSQVHVTKTNHPPPNRHRPGAATPSTKHPAKDTPLAGEEPAC